MCLDNQFINSTQGFPDLILCIYVDTLLGLLNGPKGSCVYFCISYFERIRLINKGEIFTMVLCTFLPLRIFFLSIHTKEERCNISRKANKRDIADYFVPL